MLQPSIGRTELHQLKPRAFRAVTPIEFHNTSHLQLRFDRMNVPVPALPLFYSESTGRLWTSQIKVMHEGVDRPPEYPYRKPNATACR